MSHKPDSVTAKDSGGGFTPHSEGQFAMLCVDVVDMGISVEQFADKEPREVPKVALVFASGERQERDDGKPPFLTVVTTEMTLSASEKANLRKFLESWRGRSYTPEQVAAGLPVSKLYGQSALITLEHVTTKKNRQFAKIRSISPLPKVMPAPDKSLLDEYERPGFFADRKTQYAMALAKHRAITGAETADAEIPPPEDDDDDLPF
jgi:hypothetical protein